MAGATTEWDSSFRTALQGESKVGAESAGCGVYAYTDISTLNSPPFFPNGRARFKGSPLRPTVTEARGSHFQRSGMRQASVCSVWSDRDSGALVIESSGKAKATEGLESRSGLQSLA